MTAHSDWRWTACTALYKKKACCSPNSGRLRQPGSPEGGGMANPRHDLRLLLGMDAAGQARPLQTDSAGRLVVVTQRPVVGARVTNTADLSIPSGAWTGLTFNSEVTDSDALHSLTAEPGRLTAPSAGTFLVGGGVTLDSASSGRRGLAVQLNGGNDLVLSVVPAVSGGYTRLAVCTLVQLAAGDYLTLRVFQDSGAALNALYLADNSPIFWAAML
jgi:hypothetical protein